MTEEEKQSEALKQRISNFAKLKELKQFNFMQEVEVVSGFYIWHKGKIYDECQWNIDPENSENVIYSSYIVVVLDKDEKVIDRREVQTKDLQLI